MLQAFHGDCHMFNLIVLAAEGNWPSFGQYLKRLHAHVGELIRAGIATEEFVPRNVGAARNCRALPSSHL